MEVAYKSPKRALGSNYSNYDSVVKDIQSFDYELECSEDKLFSKLSDSQKKEYNHKLLLDELNIPALLEISMN